MEKARTQQRTAQCLRNVRHPFPWTATCLGPPTWPGGAPYDTGGALPSADTNSNERVSTISNWIHAIHPQQWGPHTPFPGPRPGPDPASQDPPSLFTLEPEAEQAPKVNTPLNTQGPKGKGPITRICKWRCCLYYSHGVKGSQVLF